MMKSPRKSTIQKILDSWNLNFLALGKTRKDSFSNDSNEQFYWTHSESLTIHGYLNFKNYKDSSKSNLWVHPIGKIQDLDQPGNQM